MLPSEDQVRQFAYHRWEQRGRLHGSDLFDWLVAEQDVTLALNYQALESYSLDTQRVQYIGDRLPRQCRFCNLGESATTFREIAHAVPESLGNKSLVALDECDRCNSFFGETIDDSFGKMFLPLRTMLAIPGKKGVPSYKSRDKSARIDFDSAARGFQIKDTSLDGITLDDPSTKRLSVPLETQPYVPVQVFKCFAKMALAVMPPLELPHFQATRRWILNQDDHDGLRAVRSAGCYVFTCKRSYAAPWILLLRRITTDIPFPYMLIVIGTANLVLQSYVPLTPMDNCLVGQAATVPRIGSLAHPGGLESHWQSVQLASADVVKGNKVDFELTYESHSVKDKLP